MEGTVFQRVPFLFLFFIFVLRFVYWNGAITLIHRLNPPRSFEVDLLGRPIWLVLYSIYSKGLSTQTKVRQLEVIEGFIVKGSAMALQGTLKDFSITEIIQLIGQQLKTGILRIRRGKRSGRNPFCRWDDRPCLLELSREEGSDW